MNSMKNKIYVVASEDKMSNFYECIVGIYSDEKIAIQVANEDWEKQRKLQNNLFFGTTVYEFQMNEIQDEHPLVLWHQDIGIEKYVKYLNREELERWLENVNNTIEYSSSVPPSFYKDRDIIKKQFNDLSR